MLQGCYEQDHHGGYYIRRVVYTRRSDIYQVQAQKDSDIE